MPKLESLLQKYPELFPKDEKGKPSFYFECRDGWYAILDILLSKASSQIKYYDQALAVAGGEETYGWAKKELARYGGEHPLELWRIDQIKEKFGGLRFYCSFTDPEFIGALNFAESISFYICEVCGESGTLQRDGWYRTRCAAHAVPGNHKVEWK